MTWIFLISGTVFCTGTTDALCKLGLRTHHPRSIAWIRPGWAAIFLFPLVFFAPAPHDPSTFWTSIAMAVPIEMTAAFCFSWSIRYAPLSLTIPYLAFTPVFLLLGGWLFLGEVPSGVGIVGVLLVTSGSYFLQKDTLAVSPSKRFHWFPREKGPLLMLVVALCFSFTSLLAKNALVASNVFAFSSRYYLFTALGLLIFQVGHPRGLIQLINRPILFGAIGLLESIGFTLQFNAFLMAEVAYVIAIKRLSLLVAVVYGWLLFKEKHMGIRFAGAFLMFLGAVFIAIA